jgi:Helix-turn-helix domain
MVSTEQLRPRANKIFCFEDATPDSPFIYRVWRTRSESAQAFTSVAVPRWELVFTSLAGQTAVTVRGPETHATPAQAPEEASFFGIQFNVGAFMPSLLLDRLVDEGVNLAVAGKSFWLAGRKWELPDFEDVDLMIQRLLREDLLVRDPVVEAAFRGGTPDLCLRSVQRRFLRATGLTHGALRQIERAERAVELLDNGASILDTVDLAGYADQAHLTRSLRRFFGQTPAQITADQRA